MKRVLIITYYWPPSGGAGVQRWLKFSKYLREFGWEPVIYTPENPEPPALDTSLIAEIPANLTVIKTKIWEPYAAYKKFVGRKKEDKIKAGFLSENKTPSLTEKVSVWIRGNLFIPDARKFWIKPSIRFLADLLKDDQVDAMISTGPPHSMHLIALGLKKKLNLPWLADFRDPWTDIDFYDQLLLTKAADKKHKRLESKVLTTAHKVVTVSKSWAGDLEKLGNRSVEVITNGYDEADFEGYKVKSSRHFELLHIGSMNKDRNPHALWHVLGKMVQENESFRKKIKIRLVGQTDFEVGESLSRNGLTSFVEKVDYLPHKEVLNEASTASMLLLPLNDTPNVQGIIPGKLFEYLAMQRPILCFGPKDGNSAEIIKKAAAGFVVSFDDKETTSEILSQEFQKFTQSSGSNKTSNQKIEVYSRKSLTGEISRLLNDITP